MREWPKARGHVWGHAGLLVALLVALPGPLGAQESSDPWAPPLLEEPEPGLAGWELPVATVAITGANWLDGWSTQELVAAGGHEAWNPRIFGRNGERIVPVKIAAVVGEVGVFYLLRRWRKEAAWVFVAGVVAITVGATIHNRRLTARLRADQLQAGPLPLAGFQVSFSW